MNVLKGPAVERSWCHSEMTMTSSTRGTCILVLRGKTSRQYSTPLPGPGCFLKTATTNYVRDTPNGKRCYSGFIEVVEKGGVTWHLGHVFLRRVYTVLEWPSSGSSEFGQIGLAYSR
ncbi:hypothetical protein V5799_015103, partial [Amblyomma americanum]